MSRFPSESLAKARAVAIQAVLDASRLTHQVQLELVDDDVVQKRDRSPVTVADYGAQAVVSHQLAQAFPGIPLVGEEDASALRADPDLAAKVSGFAQQVIPEISSDEVMTAIDRGLHGGGSGLFWVLDPIDGTKGFLRRQQYAVCLALIEDGQVLVAVLGCPNLPVDPSQPDGERGCLFVAVDGHGASQLTVSSGQEARISVSSVTDTSQASFVESVEAAHADHSRQGKLAAELEISNAPVRMDSQCKFAAVARGQASLYLRLSPKPGYDQKIWDIAAGAKIIEEAGGRVSDAQGKPLNFAYGRTIGTGDLFASNGHLHDQVLHALMRQSGT
jgi:3'(2'), 5'-bisphosphate nucleotidase